MVRILFFSLVLLTACQRSQTANKPAGEDECVCIMSFDPVCGEDGKTYGNSCMADCKKVKYSKGECSKSK